MRNFASSQAPGSCVTRACCLAPASLPASPGTRRTARFAITLLATALLVLFASSANASSPLSYPARHDHTFGECRGNLVFADDHVRYDGEHAARWPYAEVQEMRLLETGRVRILGYRDSDVLRLGADRAFNFAIEGDLREAVGLLEPKLGARLVVGFAQDPGKVIAEFRVKHARGLGGGNDGVLIFGEDAIAFRSTEKGDSRSWRYSEIDSISTSGPFQLTINSFEKQRLQYATRRSFNFQLKEAMPEAVFNALWRRVNRARELSVFEDLRASIASQAEAGARAARPATRPQGPTALEAFPAASTSEAPHQSPGLAAPPKEIAGGGDIEVIERVLREEGLPAHFLGVVQVESGFNRFALSPKNARGLWQFIPETARRYGLRVDRRADERLDAEKSTRAAARYLKDLYEMFGDWKLALAGYNAGEGRVQSAQARARARDFERISPLLPRETRNYVPAVLAAFGAPAGTLEVNAPPHGLAARGYRLFAPTSLAD